MQLQRKVWGEKDIRRRRRLLLLLLLPLQLLHFSCCTLVVVESEKRGRESVAKFAAGVDVDVGDDNDVKSDSQETVFHFYF